MFTVHAITKPSQVGYECYVEGDGDALGLNDALGLKERLVLELGDTEALGLRVGDCDDDGDKLADGEGERLADAL